MFEIIEPKSMVDLLCVLLAMGAFKESKYRVPEEELERERVAIQEAVEDPEKFEYIYTKYKEEIFRFIYQRLNDKDTAFDITSQVFLKAMLNLKKYEFRGIPFSSWLYRIAVNELNVFFNKQSSQRTIKLDTVKVAEMMETSDDFAKYKTGLVEALCSLGEEDLYIVEMRFFEQRPFKVIAEILNITENNAKVKLYRILDKLKDIMVTKGDEKI